LFEVLRKKLFLTGRLDLKVRVAGYFKEIHVTEILGSISHHKQCDGVAAVCKLERHSKVGVAYTRSVK
jgi:hypothetical protein